MDHVIAPERVSRSPQPEEAPSTSLSPRVRLYLARALAYGINLSLANELEDPVASRGMRRLSAIVCGSEALDEDITLGRLAPAIEEAITLAQVAVNAASGDPVSEMAESLRTSLGLGATDAALLDLSLHASLSPPLRRGMDLLGNVDLHDAVKFIADMLQLEWLDVLQCFQRNSPFRRMSAGEASMGYFKPSELVGLAPNVNAALRTPGCRAEDILALFVRPSPPPKLSLDDFRDAGPTVELMVRYLRAVLDGRNTAVNILLYGAPGTGKTELVRATAKALDATLREVPSVDDENNPLPAWRRLTAYIAAQESLRNTARTMVLFDEIEDIFPSDDAVSLMTSKRAHDTNRHKGWLTTVLESNLRPSVWISNEISQIDPAFLRRFDLVVELRGPDERARHRLIDTLFDGLPLPETSITSLKGQATLSPGHLERLAKVLRTLAPVDQDEGAKILTMLGVETMKSLQIAPTQTQTSLLPYRADCVNTNCDLGDLAEALGRTPSARICLYGPPGTGKTEWARQLAKRLSKRLLVKRASDLLGMFVGHTEKAIRKAFDEAASDGAILLIDEADGLLRNRANTQHGWEATMVNEMLTSMESFEGIFVASTNLMGKMDPASVRRFDFKVRFDALTPSQCAALFADLLVTLQMPAPELPESTWVRLRGLTPGEFANVHRQVRLFPDRHDARTLLDLLAKELDDRPEAMTRRRIGFV